MIRWAVLVARIGDMRNSYYILDGKPEGKRPLGRLRRRWKDNIRMKLKEIGWECVD
jgi:cell wall assembly regulator SMI1